MNRCAMPWLVILLAGLAGRVGAIDLYVAASGNDQWSGMQAAPDASGDDGPFATLARAQTQVRALRRERQDEPVTVWIRGGRYAITEPLVLTPDDSGTAAAPVTYAAFEGETPILSGGRILTGWTVEPDGRWTLHLPEVQRGEWNFSQLFVNGERRHRPRVPGKGYAFISGQVAPTPRHAGKGWDRFRFHSGDIRGDWRNLSDVEVLAFHTWSMSHLRIESVDEAKRIVTAL